MGRVFTRCEECGPQDCPQSPITLNADSLIVQCSVAFKSRAMESGLRGRAVSPSIAISLTKNQLNQDCRCRPYTRALHLRTYVSHRNFTDGTAVQPRYPGCRREKHTWCYPMTMGCDEAAPAGAAAPSPAGAFTPSAWPRACGCCTAAAAAAAASTCFSCSSTCKHGGVREMATVTNRGHSVCGPALIILTRHPCRPGVLHRLTTPPPHAVAHFFPSHLTSKTHLRHQLLVAPVPRHLLQHHLPKQPPLVKAQEHWSPAPARHRAAQRRLPGAAGSCGCGCCCRCVGAAGAAATSRGRGVGGRCPAQWP